MPPIKLVKSLLIVFGLTLLAVVTWFMLVHEARQKESQADATSINCTRSLWKNDSPRYLFWKRHYALFHPEWAVLYDVGSACELTDGRTLVSFSYFRSKDPNSGGQSIALFDANNNLIRETGGFHCAEIGDIPAPILVSIEESKVVVSCDDFDANHKVRSLFDLDIVNFSWKKRTSP